MIRPAALLTIGVLATLGCYSTPPRFDPNAGGSGSDSGGEALDTGTAGAETNPPGDSGAVIIDGPGAGTGDGGSAPDGPMSPDGPAAPDGPLTPDALVARDVPVAPDAPRLATGQSCSNGTQCTTGNCVDGFCCNEACTGRCRSCAAVSSTGADGVCSPARAGMDPRQECDLTAATGCGTDGFCDGAGSCRLYGNETICAAESCSAGSFTSNRRCNGAGQCGSATPTSCAPFVCDGSSRCKTTCSGDGDCVAGSFCAGTSCSGKRALGASCNVGTECTSGTCVENVCCNEPCTGQCRSCKAVNTNGTDGVCGNVRAGADPGSSCTGTDPTSCGLDGECDGLGGCRKWGTTTVCAQPVCSTTTSATPTRRCDGNGNCPAASASQCGTFVCASGMCKTSCSGHGDCASGFYCAGGPCAAKKPLGQACGSGPECSSNVCGGRCCTQACTCPIASSSNLLANAGFDSQSTGIANWLASPDDDVGHMARWEAADADSCPFSGSMFLFAPNVPGQGIVTRTQCVPVTAGTNYNLGASVFHGPGVGVAEGGCLFSFRDGLNCAGSPLDGTYQTTAIRNEWKVLSMNFVAPPGSVSLRVSCYSFAPVNETLSTWIDKVFVTPAPGGY